MPDLPPLGQRLVSLIVILVPLGALVVAVAYAWGWGLGWLEIGLLAGMYLATGFGVTIGYHRLFTHRSFQTGPALTGVLGILGSFAVEGSILHWVSLHRCHHQYSDKADDPHSPHGHGAGVRGVLKGFWRAHAGWLLERPKADLERYVRDLRRSRMIRILSALFPLWVLLGLLIPTALGGVLSMSWTGAALGLLWGGLVRILLVHHVTWSVNSICHLWGSRPYQSDDQSRNNVVVGLLALGEGWHNNHHAFPTSARHGLRWWQLDLSYVLIRVLEGLGLVWGVRVPTPQRMTAKRRCGSGAPVQPARLAPSAAPTKNL